MSIKIKLTLQRVHLDKENINRPRNSKVTVDAYYCKFQRKTVLLFMLKPVERAL